MGFNGFFSSRGRKKSSLYLHEVPDIDNLIKGLFDHLAKEDSYIWGVEATKIWAEKGSITLNDLL